MAYYVVGLPEKLDRYLFDKLGSDGPVHDGIKRKLSDAYGELPKIAGTSAEDDGEAIRNVIFRNMPGRVREVDACSFAKMFGDYASRFAFPVEIPEREIRYEKESRPKKKKRNAVHEADTFQRMEFAIGLSDLLKTNGRVCRPEDCFNAAVEIINSSKS